MRRILDQPLARWGFPTLAVLAALTEQPIPALICVAATLLAWKDTTR